MSRPPMNRPNARIAAALLVVLDDLDTPISEHAKRTGVSARSLIFWLEREGIDPARWPRKANGREGANTLTNTPWNEDETCMRILEEHPHGATLEVIAEAYGLTRERIRQIECMALEKMQRRLRAQGVEP